MAYGTSAASVPMMRPSLRLVAPAAVLTLTVACPSPPSAPTTTHAVSPAPKPVQTATSAASIAPTVCANQRGSSTALSLGPAEPLHAPGIDVSHFNGPVPWLTLSQAGLTYAFAKATEGLDYTDPRFAQNWAAMRACGIPRGAYHFLVPKDDPVAQAEHFLSVLDDDLGELPLVVDVERGARDAVHPCAELQSTLRIFLQTLEAKTKHAVMIYTGRSFWKTRMCDDQEFSSRPLWVARYSKAQPQLFGGWKRWDFWQYSQEGEVGGSRADLDRFRGDVAALQAWRRRP